MEIRVLRTEGDYLAALQAVSALIDLDPAADSLEDERLDVLGTLIQAYEAKHDPIDPPDPIDAIKFRMEQSDRERPCALRWPTQSCVGGFVSQTTAVALEL